MTCFLCGDVVALEALLGHMRLMHPHVYEPEMADWPVEVAHEAQEWAEATFEAAAERWPEWTGAGR